jgi:uncharacterized protein (DUF58 family)
MFYWRDRRFPAIALLSLLLARTSGGAFFHLLFYFLGCYLVVAYLYLRYAGNNLTILMTPERRAALAGERVPVKLKVYNEGLLPAPLVTIRDLTPLSDKLTSRVALDPLRSTVLAFEWSNLRRGKKKLGPVEILLSDPLGIIELRTSNEVPGELVVYPNPERLSFFPLPARQPFGHSRRHEASTVDRTSVAELREFRDGDSRKAIDWKATARQQRLMVRRFDLLAGAGVNVFLDMNAKTTATGHDDPEWVDRAARSAATVAEYVLRHGEALSFHCCGVSYQRLHPARGARQLSAALELLATAEAGMGCDTLKVVRDVGMSLPSRSTIVLISPRADTECLETLFSLAARGHSIVQVACPAGSTPVIPFRDFAGVVVPPGETLSSVLGEREKVLPLA